MDPVRLFHFDIPTAGNYGDKALFPTVRDAFRGFGEGLFRFTAGSSLRVEATPELIDTINATADAVVVGGGGLFLQDTARNANSGWQWNISTEMLGRLQVPVIVFAVGNNRFPGQPDFSTPMLEHVAATLESSLFFGLRNTGSIETMSALLPEGLRDRIQYQPCPTVLGGMLYPHLLQDQDARDALEPTLAVQSLVHRRQIDAGFDADAIQGAMIDAAEHFAQAGWRILSTPFHPDDAVIARQLEERVPSAVPAPLAGAGSGYLDGYRLFAEVDIVLGTRGHAQLIPFSMGAIPVSVGVHDKLGYFARDLDLPDLVVPASGTRAELAAALVERIVGLYERRQEVRARMRAKQEEFRAITTANLRGIHQALAVGPAAETTAITPRPVPELHVQSFGVNAAADAAEHMVRTGWKVNGERRAAQQAREEAQKLRAAADQLRAKLTGTEAELGAARRERDEIRRLLSEHKAERQKLNAELREVRRRLVSAERFSLSHPIRMAKNLIKGARRHLSR